MSENTEPGGGAAPRDPWAPPDSRVDLGKRTGEPSPPAVHDQRTVTSMPGAAPAAPPGAGHGPPPGTGPIPGAFGPPGPADVPPPPAAPYGAAPLAGPPAGQYGYPPPQPYPGGYPGYDPFGGHGWAPAPSNGMGTAALVLGIVAVVGICFGGIGALVGIPALVFGVLGRGRAKRGEANNGGMALAGIILGSIGVVAGAAFLGFIVWAGMQDGAGDDEPSGSYDDPFATSLVVDTSR
ncbi:DUF4190 domain-containing protein [uncultured Streptomyces sp.]|uniref:DUF4190 domain-containing protein n=1 Tax=uncultured Streptomyces sp. TaxID=174707 RepID=UPI00260C8DB9|nr:DUF4190 domain-containing protein [uncultured Streptomyces sp.]